MAKKSNNMTTYRCVNDAFERCPDSVYNDVDDFLAMCRACFSEAPDLVMRDGSVYLRDTGALVLVPVSSV